jgi:hypothetical protein
MVAYSNDFLTGIPDVVRQLVYSVDALYFENQNFDNAALTDFLADSIALNLVQDTSAESDRAYLNLDIQLLTIPWHKLAFKNKVTAELRITTNNTGSVYAQKYSPREAVYDDSQFYLVQNLPAYLLDFTDGNNTLERLVYWLCREVLRVQRWIENWNNLQLEWADRIKLDELIANGQTLVSTSIRELVDIEAERDALILIKDESSVFLNPPVIYTPTQFEQLTGNFGNAIELENYLGGNDPGNGEYFSNGLLEQLQSANSNDYGTPGDSPFSNTNSEVPTLKDC